MALFGVRPMDNRGVEALAPAVFAGYSDLLFSQVALPLFILTVEELTSWRYGSGCWK